MRLRQLSTYLQDHGLKLSKRDEAQAHTISSSLRSLGQNTLDKQLLQNTLGLPTTELRLQELSEPRLSLEMLGICRLRQGDHQLPVISDDTSQCFAMLRNASHLSRGSSSALVGVSKILCTHFPSLRDALAVSAEALLWAACFASLESLERLWRPCLDLGENDQLFRNCPGIPMSILHQGQVLLRKSLRSFKNI